MTLRVLGLSGPSGCGKDAAVKLLVDEGWAVVKCADPIWQMLETMDLEVCYRGCYMKLNSVIRDFGREQAKKEVPQLRGLLQRIGDSGRETISEDVWANIMYETAASLLNSGEKVAVTDIRYANEAEALKDLGGAVLQIERPGVVRMQHRSENQNLEGYVDARIVNAGTLEDLQRDVYSWAQSGKA